MTMRQRLRLADHGGTDLGEHLRGPLPRLPRASVRRGRSCAVGWSRCGSSLVRGPGGCGGPLARASCAASDCRGVRRRRGPALPAGRAARAAPQYGLGEFGLRGAAVCGSIHGHSSGADQCCGPAAGCGTARRRAARRAGRRTAAAAAAAEWRRSAPRRCRRAPGRRCAATPPARGCGCRAAARPCGGAAVLGARRRPRSGRGPVRRRRSAARPVAAAASPSARSAATADAAATAARTSASGVWTAPARGLVAPAVGCGHEVPRRARGVGRARSSRAARRSRSSAAAARSRWPRSMGWVE